MPRVLRYSLAVALALSTSAFAASITVDFESFLDGDSVTTQLPGLTFTNTAILTAGASLNEFELPPRSGVNVASDSGGPISLTFDTPVPAVWAFFTYLVPVTLEAFDATNSLLGSTTAVFTTNLALSGDPGSSANERLELTFAQGIARIVITGGSAGGSFVFDDLTFGDPETRTVIPEPATIWLCLTTLAFLGSRARKQAGLKQHAGDRSPLPVRGVRWARRAAAPNDALFSAFPCVSLRETCFLRSSSELRKPS